MKIKGIDHLSLAEIDAELEAGGRFVNYQYCISLLLVTLRRPSSVMLLTAHDRGVIRGLPYTFVTLLLGWWGVPWGPIYTAAALLCNFGGGHDVTLPVRRFLGERPTEPVTSVVALGED